MKGLGFREEGRSGGFQTLANLVATAGEDTDEKRLGWRLIVRMDPERRIPKFEIEDADPEPAGADDLDAALAEALERGVIRAVEILSGPEMLTTPILQN